MKDGNMTKVKKVGVFGIIIVLVFSAFIPTINSQLGIKNNQIPEKSQVIEKGNVERNNISQPVFDGRLEDVYLTHGKRIYYGNVTYQTASEDLYFIDNTTIDADFVWIALVLNPHFVDNTYGNGTVPQYRNVNGNPCGHNFNDLNISDRQEIKLYDGNNNLVFYAGMDLIHRVISAPSGYGIPAWGSGESQVYFGDSSLVKYNTSTCFDVNYYYNTPPYNVLTDSPTLGDQNYTLYPGYEEWEHRIIYELKVNRSLFGGNSINVSATEVLHIHASPNKIGPHTFHLFPMYGSLGDYVWEDVDKDGRQDAGETGLSSVTVILHYYYKDSNSTVLSITTTISTGSYHFNYLAPGDYYLTFVLPVGYRFTLPDQTDDAHDSDANVATGETGTISLSPDEDDMTWDAGMYLKEYSLTIIIEGNGIVVKNPDQTNYTYGQVVTLTANPATGWSFNHWAGDLTGNINPTSITINGNKSVTAYFTQIVYTLTITINPPAGGSVTTDPNPPYHYGDVVTLTATENPGYTFSHWSGDATGTNPITTVTMNGNKAVTAHFTQNTYTLTITSEGQGTITKNPDQPTYTYGQVVTLTANPATGWTFNHWEGDLTGSQNPTTITMNGNKQVTANFTITTGYTLTITINPTAGGTVTLNPNPPYDYGEVVTLTATANPGYTFNHWSGDATGTNPITTVTMNGNKAVTAHFTQNTYTLTITIDPTDGGTVAQDPEPPYHYGDIVTLTATPNPGYTFDHWSGDASGSSTVTTVTMNGNKSVTAHFTQIEYSLTITVDPIVGGTVTVDPSPPYYYNDIVTLTAIANTGYVFDHWSGDASGSSPVTTVTMDENKLVTAHFTLKQYTLIITIDGQGTVIKDPDQTTYAEGTHVELTAFTESGWIFNHWSGDLNGSDNPETIIMTSDKNVTAHFDLDEVPPTIQIGKPEKALYIMNFKIRPYILDRKPLIIGKIDIEVNASDAQSGINRVEFLIDSTLVGSINTEPYRWTWSNWAFFRHSIKVVAYDNAGNSAFDEISVWKFF